MLRTLNETGENYLARLKVNHKHLLDQLEAVGIALEKLEHAQAAEQRGGGAAIRAERAARLAANEDRKKELEAEEEKLVEEINRAEAADHRAAPFLEGAVRLSLCVSYCWSDELFHSAH